VINITGFNYSNFNESTFKPLKAKFHYAILVADRFEAGRRPAASC